ncbi:hypothetical protein GCM10011497_15900 [Elstera cyanobacteriorum]|uniref:DUF6414 family protein n=1 Tax=Elstera cyanobacteriorum TaxID=2022747 RepID=UPI0011400A3E|nr:hypothetical protein [Elstera cyanobacteriorum]GFZ87740.1 hypothetical protein GCM10011497_15900 [Elstera cyanobacteriorum]
MSFYMEPVYLNEKMVLNCAAYVFKGVSLEKTTEETTSSKGKGSISLGFKFLQDFISPVSSSLEAERNKSVLEKTARRYTLGGLHMALIDALEEEKHIHKSTVLSSDFPRDHFVQLDAILKPIDFFNIIEITKVSAPIIAQIIKNFGTKLNKNFFDPNMMKELPKYEEIILKILSEIEEDYLRSGLLEMIMVSPIDGRQIGVVDIDVSDADARSIKAKLTDGHFKIIGRVYRHIPEGDKLSIVQRTIISTIQITLEKLLGESSSGIKYRESMAKMKEVAEKGCQFYIDGPAFRVIAMSVCI